MRRVGLGGWVGLGLVCLLGLIVRFRGLDFFLPHYTPSDELVMVDQVDNLRLERPQTAADGTGQPSYPLLGAYLVRYAELYDPGSGPAELAEHLRRASALRLDLRAITLLLSWLAVPGTWFLARRFLSPGWSTLAAALMAFSMLDVSYSQMGRSHGPITALLLLGVVAAMRLGRTGSAGAYALAGVAAALAVGYLHSGAALLGPLLVAHLISRRLSGRASGWWLLVVPVLLLVAVRLSYPFHFEAWNTAEVELQDAREVNISGHRLWWGDFDGSGFLAVVGTLYSYEPGLLLMVVAGLVALIGARRSFAGLGPTERGDFLVAASFAVPYLALMGLYARTAERFVLPLWPFLATVGAFGLARLTRSRPRIGGTVAVLFVLASAVGTWGLTSVRAGKDTAAIAARWIMANLDPAISRTFLIPYHTLPLMYGEDSLETNWNESRHTEWLEYLHAQDPADLIGPRWDVFHPARRNATELMGEDPMAWLRAEGFDHVLIQHVRPSFREKILPEMRAALQEQAELLARFTPMRRDDGEPARVDYNYSRNVLKRPFVWHLLQAKGMGSTLELYRLAP